MGEMEEGTGKLMNEPGSDPNRQGQRSPKGELWEETLEKRLKGISSRSKVLAQTLGSHGEFGVRAVNRMLLNYVPGFSNHLFQLFLNVFFNGD